MPRDVNGVYVITANSNERAHEAELCYYLNFQIVAARHSIKKILIPSMDELKVFQNKCQYYHFYSDHLLYSIGCICVRFQRNNDRKKDARAIINRANIRFRDEDYPELYRKEIRNTVEHINEYDADVIEKIGGVGGFNVIDEDIDEDVANEILNKNHYIYTLNNLSKEIIVIKKEERFTINLEKLDAELIRLQKQVEDFREISSCIFGTKI